MRAGYVAAFIALILGVFIYFAITPDSAYAHGSGLTLSATTSSYFIDVDYDDYTIYSNETGRFDLKLFTDPARTTSVDFAQVFVRIEESGDLPEGKTIFAGWLVHATYGPTGLSISLPRAGEYKMSVRFAKDDKTIEAVTLPFTVIARDSGYTTRDYALAAIFAIFALAALSQLYVIVIRRRS